ncbi:signal recognition particle-docking protein FtsY, partial [Gammaproteobacteria bacterium]|nr:signal recognition particle-docking protein FtsY [Gammaproteobacteria bacterium]
SARANNIDVLIADTAGRLHNKNNLMEEMKKIYRISNKFDNDLQSEVLLILDAGTGQNALVQAKQFNETIGIDGIVLTKLDGTAKGGIVFSLADQLNIPIRFIGVGEQIEDLRPFNAAEFIDALLISES